MSPFTLYQDTVYTVFKRLSIRKLMMMGLFFSVLSSLALGGYGYFSLDRSAGQLDVLAKGVSQFHGQLGQQGAMVEVMHQQASALRAEAESAATEAEAGADLMLLVMMLSTGAILIIMLNSYLSIRVPLRQLIDRTRDIAEGEADLTQRLVAMENTELGELAHWFNVFVARLQVLVSSVKMTSDQMAAGTDKVRSISDSTLSGVLKQQAETDRVATAMTQMNAAVHEVAHSAASASVAAEGADLAAKQGKDVVDDAVTVIEQLAGEVERAAAVIKRLEAEAGGIGSLLDVVKSIAEQTNLLALNAAIEAARAGEAGCGFAVVADEVRNLANRTEQSTQDIHDKIDRLQRGAADAVKVMRAGQTRAQDAVEKAEVAGNALVSITRAIGEISVMNTQIAGAAEEQSAVAEDVNQSVVNITAVAGDTSSGARCTASESQALAEYARKLGGLMGEFRV